MGLDMYMVKKHYYGGQYRGKDWHDEGHNLNIGGDFVDKNKIKLERIGYITEEVGYWRKANHIHRWFIENCSAEGVDDCRDLYVSKDDLTKLASTIRDVLGGKTKPEDALPTSEGFFFGGQNYDEGYFEDCRYTLELIGKLIAEQGGAEYYYHASW
jgi:hypothetical protein